MSAAKPAGAFRILHTADWHLGKPLGELSRQAEHELFLDFLLDTIERVEVDALIVAGDIFDSANPPQAALRLYYDFLSRLYATRKCTALFIAGNHDSPAQLEAPSEVLRTLRATVVGAARDDDPIVLLPDSKNPRLAVAAIPFLRDRDLRSGHLGQDAETIRAALVDGIAGHYARAAEALEKHPELPSIATGHLTVSGTKVSDSEREIHVGGLGTVSDRIFPSAFDYVALGHLHRPQTCGEAEHIRYSGSPIPLSFSESLDTKSVTLADFDQEKLIGHSQIKLPMWRRLVQMRAKRSELEAMMAAGFELEGELETWVEVVIDDPVPGENVLEQVRAAAEGKPYQVVRIVCGSRKRTAGITSAEITEAEEDLLGDPMAVFKRRLEREEGLEEAEGAALEIAFQQVVDQYQQEDGEP